jgi:DNA-directed RNA polymerase subunit L
MRVRQLCPCRYFATREHDPLGNDEPMWNLHIKQSSRSIAQTMAKRATFTFDGVRTSIVNGLRRVILAEVPYIATFRDENRAPTSAGGFVVRENTGRLHNDMLCDRLALVPIHLTKREVDQYIPGSITVRLAKKNDGNARIDVTSKHFTVYLFDRPHPNARACYPPCPITGDWPLITRLYLGESIDVTATLEKSAARRHAAFAVASLVAMAPILDEDRFRAERSEIESAAFASAVDSRLALNALDHVERKRMIALDSEGRPKGHTLTVESEWGLTTVEIAREGADVLVRKFGSDDVTYEAKKTDGRITFTVKGQDHTFGSILQDVGMAKREEIGIRSIGYFQPSPLHDSIVVVVETDQDSVCAEVFSKLRSAALREIEKGKEAVSI